MNFSHIFSNKMQIRSGNYMFQIDCLQKQHINDLNFKHIHLFSIWCNWKTHFTVQPSFPFLHDEEFIYWILSIVIIVRKNIQKTWKIWNYLPTAKSQQSKKDLENGLLNFTGVFLYKFSYNKQSKKPKCTTFHLSRQLNHS